MNVVVDHVTKTIHGAVVLQDISLNFESGKVYGLQGENGSGKTMLLRLMCGLIYATEGSVSVMIAAWGRIWISLNLWE